MNATAPFSTTATRRIFSFEAFVQRMLDYEAALARAQAASGVIPPDAATAIGARCSVKLFDLAEIERQSIHAGTPVTPLVRMLADHVDADWGGYVHWGATSQDVVDTGLILQVRDALIEIEKDLLRIGAACADLADRYRTTAMAGRTLLQHAVPITFGFKAARWLSLTTRLIQRVRNEQRDSLAVQLGGAAGTLAALTPDGIAVLDALARELGLAVPDLPWHAERDRFASIAASAAIVAGGAAKIARDVTLLMQTEVREVAEGAGASGGQSSAMPHKRNPVAATWALAAARLAAGPASTLLSTMVQEHERDAGNWQAEWHAVPQTLTATAAAVEHVAGLVENLEVDGAAMASNLDISRGRIMAEAVAMALARRVGRTRAYGIVERASRRAAEDDVDLRTALHDDREVVEILPPDALDDALDPQRYLGSSDIFVQRALDAFKSVARPAT